MPRQKTFVIVGLGLIGGSLAASIRKQFKSAKVIGVSRTPRHIAFAKKKKFIHSGTADLKTALLEADFVVICTPVDTIPKFIQIIERYAKPGTVVMDVGSTKSAIVHSAARKHFRRILFIGSHPLAGSHLTGVEHARSDLFEGAHVFITPVRHSNPKALRSVKNFWRKLNSKVHVVSPETHDQIVSEISHLPHAAAVALMHSVSNASLRFAASGFLDTTRIAEGDPNLWVPIFLTNRSRLISGLQSFKAALNTLEALLKKGSATKITRFLRHASLKRLKLS